MCVFIPFPSSLSHYQNPRRIYTSNFILLVQQQLYYFIFPIFPLKNFSSIDTVYLIYSFLLSISSIFILSHMLHPHSLQSLLFSLFSILSVDNVLLSINLISLSYLLRYFGYTRLFLSSSRAISYNIFFSQFPYLHLISRFVLSLCFAGSLLVALTAHNQYIPLHISYPYFEPPSRPLPLILTHQSHNATTLIASSSSLYLFSFLAHF